MNKLLNKLLSMVFPHRCISCGRVMEQDGFCEECGLDTAKADTVFSGTHDANCDGIVPLYYYYGSVRRALLNLKFYGRPHIADYFGEMLAHRILSIYGEYRFDAVCFVPMSEKMLRRRRYNQAELLGVAVSEILRIPILPAGLVKVRENRIQHKLDAKQRAENVAGAYAVMDDVSGKRILLIDDIRTTGATLNECAGMLKAAGAYEIVCAVVAVSRKTGL